MAAVVAITCLGCWEEIHYDPSRYVAKNEDDTPEPAEDAAAESTPGEPMPAEPAASEAGLPELTADELFEAPAVGPEATPGTEEGTDDRAAVAALPVEPAPAEAPPVDVAAEAPANPATPADRLNVWTAASQWSLAAAMQGKRVDASRIEPVMREASAAAAAIGVELPPLPGGEQANVTEASVVESLLGDEGAALSNRIGARFGPAEGATASLAIRSHAWLLSYSPRNPPAADQVAAMRDAAEGSGLPASLWKPLLEMVEQRAEFVAVRQAIFDLHRGIAADLKASLGEQP